MTERKSLNWLELLTGVLLVVLGVFSFTRDGFAIGSFVILYGIAAILMGIWDIVLYIHLDRRTGFGPVLSLVTGIFSILAGLLLLFNLSAGKWAMTILFPMWFIAHCASRLSTLALTRLAAGRGMFYFSLVINILGLFLGIFLLFAPLVTYVAIAYLVGSFFILSGIGTVFSAFT